MRSRERVNKAGFLLAWALLIISLVQGIANRVELIRRGDWMSSQDRVIEALVTSHLDDIKQQTRDRIYRQQVDQWRDDLAAANPHLDIPTVPNFDEEK